MNKQYEGVEGHDNLVRDPNTGMILNINRTEVENAREAKKIRQRKLKEEQDLKNTVNTLQEEMKDIKGLISQLIEKL